MTDLLEQLDEAAALLLKKIGVGDTVDAQTAVSLLPEQVKAFEAVAKWVTIRKSLAPAEVKPDSKIDVLRDKFHASGERRRGRAAKAPADKSSDMDGGLFDNDDDNRSSASTEPRNGAEH